MKTQNTLITPVMIFGLWLALVLGCSTLRKAREAREGAPVNISAAELSKAYESNETTAAESYGGKTVIVTGVVGDTDTPEIGNPAVTLIDAGKKPVIQCFGFSADQRDAVSKLKVGQTVSVKGKCMGRMMGRLVVLEDSVIQ